MSGKSCRREIPVAKKLEVLKRYRNGEKLYRLEQDTGFQRAQIKNWLKNEDRLLSVKVKQKRKRVSGSGPSAKFQEVEEHLFSWFKDEREQKHQVNYLRLREKAQEIATELQVSRFFGSNKWIDNFCRRHHIGSRRITHQGQQDGRIATEKRRIITDFLARSVQITSGYKLMQIYNMDKTPCYFDMASDQTLHFRGEKNVDGIDTDHKKSRFTVALCCSADGRMIKSLIVFKGLKKVPKLSVPTNVEVTVSMGGSMNTGSS